MKKNFLILSAVLLLTTFFIPSQSNAQMPRSSRPTAAAPTAAAPAIPPVAIPTNTVAPAPAPIVPVVAPAAPVAPTGSGVDQPTTTSEIEDCVKELLADPNYYPNTEKVERTWNAYSDCTPNPNPNPNPSPEPSKLDKCVNDTLANASTCSDAPCNGSEQQAGCVSSFPSGACCCSSLEGANERIKSATLECFFNNIIK